MISKKNKIYISFAIIISIVIGVLIHLNDILDFLVPDRENIELGRHGSYEFIRNVFITFLVSLCTFLLNYYLIKPLDRLKKTSLKSVTLAILLTLISVYILSDFFHAIAHLLSNRNVNIQFNVIFVIRDLIISLFILSGIYIIKNVYDRQAYELENERLTRENLQSQYESLKNQLSPHFLFNSLSALKTLIGEDTQKAKLYIDNISQVLRYSLQSRGLSTVTLSEELEELKSYVFLIEMRYEENITIAIDIPDSYHKHLIPRLSLLTLVENAVKHNVISKKNPLLIKIFIDNDKIVVLNTLKEKLTQEGGTGIGLSNLISQYKMLNEKEILIIRTENEFRVDLPLIKSNHNESSHS